jgi:glycopeptide antibiotics resistance protein
MGVFCYDEKKKGSEIMINVRDLMELMMFFSVFWLIVRVVVFAWRREFSIKSEMMAAAVPFAVMFIYFATVFPFPFFNPYHFVETGLGRSYNVIPFKSIMGSLNHFYYMVPLRNIGGNILLFVPLGFALAFRFYRMNIWKGILCGLLVSLSMELCQFVMGYRSFDVDDLILNGMGTFIGIMTCKGFAKINQKETFSSVNRKIG